MNLKNAFFATVLSAWLANWVCGCSDNWKSTIAESDTVSVVEVDNMKTLPRIPDLDVIKRDTLKEISVCLEQDENSHTYTWALESIENAENTTLEFPVSHLFQKYWNRPHPLAVRWIKKDFRALLWKNWIEDLSDKIPQKLSPRSNKITGDTQYEIWDTIRFQLINPSLKWVFPKYLWDQLKEDWFQTFSDSDSTEIKRRIVNKNQNIKKFGDKPDFIYDIVVKRLSDGKAALALYRDWELSMATYVSVWLNSRKTKTWQFKVLSKNPYYFSKKYKSPMPYWLQFDELWFYFHQEKVTWYPASHGCVRLPGLYAASLFSFIKWSKSWDVFIDNNLYIQKK